MEEIVTAVKRTGLVAKKRLSAALNLRQVLPASAIRGIKSLEWVLGEMQRHFISVDHKCKYDHILHCAPHKTASVWTRQLLSDPIVYRASGMPVREFIQKRRASLTHQFRPGRDMYRAGHIHATAYITYKDLIRDVPLEGENWRAFYVIRDPRDIVVSWYYSTRDTHVVDRQSIFNAHRRNLRRRGKKEGLKYVIDAFEWKGKFHAMRTWAEQDDGRVKVVRFEDLTSRENASTFEDLFAFLNIAVQGDRLEALLQDYSFEALTGRARETIDESSNLRSGGQSKWQRDFDAELEQYFENVAGDLIDKFGYR